MTNTESIDILRSKMEPRGFSFNLLTLGQPSRDYMRITSPAGNSIIVSASSPLYPFATSSSRTIYRNKQRLYALAQSLGIEVPKSIALDYSQWDARRNEIEQFLEEYKKLIVKPDSASGSLGLTIDIEDTQSLEVAISFAAKVSGHVLIQQQFIGEELRFAVIGGKVAYVLRRQKAAVIGDGVSTVKALIQRENNDRANLQSTLLPYPKLDENLVYPATLSDENILKANERRELNKSTMIRGGASIFNVTGQIHQGYVDQIELLASQFGPGFLAIDIMVADESVAPTSDNYVLLEANTNPALSLFYSCRDGHHAYVVEEHLCDAIRWAIDGWQR